MKMYLVSCIICYDFCHESNNALFVTTNKQYAENMLKELNGEIKLLHTWAKNNYIEIIDFNTSSEFNDPLNVINAYNNHNETKLKHIDLLVKCINEWCTSSYFNSDIHIRDIEFRNF